MPRIQCVSYQQQDKQFLCNPGHDDSLADCLLDSMVRVESVDDKAVFVFVPDANAHLSQKLYSQSLLLIGKGVMLLIFVICCVVSSWLTVLLTLLVIDLLL